MACHQDIPQGSIPIRMLGKVADIVDLSYATDDAHSSLLRENNILISWVKAIGVILLILIIPIGILAFIKRKKIIEIVQRLKTK